MAKYYLEILTSAVFLAAVFHPSLSLPAAIVLITLLIHSKAPAFKVKSTPQDDVASELADLKRQVNALALQKGLKR